MYKSILTFLLLFLSTAALYADNYSCSQKDRLSMYNGLEEDTDKLLKSLPAFSPSRIKFFEKAKLEYFDNHKEKYEHTVTSNDFITYNNRAEIEKIQELVRNIALNTKKNNTYLEVELLFNLNNKFILNASRQEGFMNSKTLLDRGVATQEYYDIAKTLTKTIMKINSCGYKIAYELKNKH